MQIPTLERRRRARIGRKRKRRRRRRKRSRASPPAVGSVLQRRRRRDLVSGERSAGAAATARLAMTRPTVADAQRHRISTASLPSATGAAATRRNPLLRHRRPHATVTGRSRNESGSVVGTGTSTATGAAGSTMRTGSCHKSPAGRRMA